MNAHQFQNLHGRLRILCLLGFVVAGCGGSDDPFERTDVTGTITLGGQPVQFGEIYFKGPVDDNDQTAQAFLPIRDGKFESVGTQHPTPGENTVTITIYETDPNAETEDGSTARQVGIWTGKHTVGAEPITIDINEGDLEKSS